MEMEEMAELLVALIAKMGKVLTVHLRPAAAPAAAAPVMVSTIAAAVEVQVPEVLFISGTNSNNKFSS